MKGLYKAAAQIWYQGGQGVGVATLTGDRTLSGTSAHAQYLTASGANRNVLLPALGPNGAGQWFIIRNAGASNNIVVKTSDGGTTVVTLTPGDFAYLISGKVSGSLSWYVAQTTVGLVALTLTGALAAAAATFTGRVTTTDGVTSGDTRVVGGNVHTKTTATTVANTVTETTIGSHSLAANMIKAGSQVRVRGALRVTGVSGTPTVTLRLKLGSTTYIASAALNVIADDVVSFDAVITGRAAPGASAEVVIEGAVMATQSGTPAVVPKVVAPANYATNGALAVAATVQWSAAHASNSLTCDSFSVDVVG